MNLMSKITNNVSKLNKNGIRQPNKSPKKKWSTFVKMKTISSSTNKLKTQKSQENPVVSLFQAKAKGKDLKLDMKKLL